MVIVIRHCLLLANVMQISALLSPTLRTHTMSHIHTCASTHTHTHTHTSTSSTSSTSLLSSTNTNGDATKQESARAGEDGYSLLRQPLTWDSSVDPSFDTPMSMDGSEDDLRNKDAEWFQNMSTARSSSSSSRSVMGNKDENGMNGSNQMPKKQRKMEFEQTLDLFQRTLDTLDYPIVLNALKDNCGTAPAKIIVDESTSKGQSQSQGQGQGKSKTINRKKAKIAKDDIRNMGLTAPDVQGAHERYQALKEMKIILAGDAEIPRNPKTKTKAKKIERPPLTSSNFDISPMMTKIDDGGVLDGPDVLEFTTILNACWKVSDWCNDLERAKIWSVEGVMNDSDDAQDENENEKPFQELPKLGRHIYVDIDLLDLLEDAFDDKGRLSGTTFQGIGRLRAKVRALKSDILSTLDTLMSSPSIKNKLSLESGGSLYSEVNGRIVIPVQEKYKSSVGIIHDSSRSGKTHYVEPSEVVGPTNEMNQAIMELKQEEMKVWRMLTKEIVDHREDIERSIAAVAQLDLVMARIRLADRISGVIPEVKDEGVISLKTAKHPVLLLRELENVVGSDIDLGAGKNQGLVLTGPNSGGKTIILKLMGLVALMVRDGIPIPCHPDGARADFFGPVLADIGDIQSVDDDLSTFSGHMLVCREVLASSGENALVLMDELGSGTDPNQGVAIAQSILEALMSSGSRVAITTHYLQLKQLATSDDRFSVGAMQFVNGRPTYKLLPGVIGESFALSVAERLNLPQQVIDRAAELMDSDTKQMGDLIRNMEDQKALIDEQAAELKAKRKELDDLEQNMRKQQEKLERKQVNARREEARKFAAKLEEKESVLEEILQTLKSNPSKKLIAKSWDELRYVKRDALTEAENIPSVLRQKEKAAAAAEKKFAEMVPLAEMREKPDIKSGDILVVCKNGPLKGKDATVINTSGKRVDVTVSGMPMTMKLTEVALRPSSFGSAPPKTNTKKGNNKMSKMAMKALAEEMQMGGEGAIASTAAKKSGGPTMRLSSNTVDCIGLNFDQARRKCEDKFGRMMMTKDPVVYILHGHGAQGVLKSKIRTWLGRDKQWVKKWKGADKEDGGDAFTRVELKNSLL